MDVRFINPFISAIKSVFETMVHTTVTVKKPEKVGEDHPAQEVAGVIGLSGAVVGSVILGFSNDTAGKVATAFAGIPIEQGHPDFADAIGELANMVAGSAKAKFEGHNVSISLPNVIVGKEHKVLHSQTCPRIQIPCDTPLGVVVVELGFRPEVKQSKSAPALVGAAQS